jgi:hypothetical protein
MKKTLLILIAFASVQMAFATAALELVSGNNILYVADGASGTIACSTGGVSVACSTFGATGDNNPLTGNVSIAATNFNGWAFTSAGGSSSSSTCNGATGGVGCLNDQTSTTNTGAGTLTVYFADSGFNTEPGFITGFSSPLQTGSSATQTAYAFTGSPTLSATNLTPTPGSGQIGTALTILPPGVNGLASGGGGMTGPFSLELKTVFTDTAAGGGYNSSGNIAATPEPASIVLFSGVALLAFGAIRRKMQA